MPISSDLSSLISDMYMNPAVAAEHIQVLNGQSVARVVTAAGNILGATDSRLILNAASGAKALALPAGVNGMTFRISKAAADAATWSLTPNGSDVVDANVTAALAVAPGASSAFSMHHVNGRWYLL